MEENKIKTLKETSQFQRYKNKEYGDEIKWGVIFSQTSNSYQVYDIEEDRYVEVSSDRRGCIPERDNGGFVFDVSAAPQSSSDLKESLLAVAVEKLQNDIYSINKILNIFKEEKGLKNKEVSLKDMKKKIEEKILFWGE